MDREDDDDDAGVGVLVLEDSFIAKPGANGFTHPSIDGVALGFGTMLTLDVALTISDGLDARLIPVDWWFFPPFSTALPVEAESLPGGWVIFFGLR